MTPLKKAFSPWSTLSNMLGKPAAWWPEEEHQRMMAYDKYDQLYWNDPTQYAIRVLENEEPLYIPNGKTVVDTTANYLLKGLKVELPSGDSGLKALSDFMKRERFYSKFHTNKLAGITRGDWAFHLVADETKLPGERVSIETVHPGSVIRVPDEDDPEQIVRVHLVSLWIDPDDPEKTEYVKKLTYHRTVVNGKRRIAREMALWKLVPNWYGKDPKPEMHKQLIKPGLLPESIDTIPVFWYPNVEWEGQLYGSSELRGLENLAWAVSQGATDTQGALSLEGLGVFATDGGRPVNDAGEETEWEVAPGKVMEVPLGSYFRRVEGVGSITPMLDQIKYIEQKMYQSAGVTDVALGQVDVQVAQSGIALAIRFAPTLAKIEQRDTAGVEITHQMFYNLAKFYLAYEGIRMGEFSVELDANKLPVDRTRKLDELNNLFDRKIISRKRYREEVVLLGIKIDHDDEEAQLQKEAEADAKRSALAAPPGLQANAEAAAAGQKGFEAGSDKSTSTVDADRNGSNNRSRPNESSGTEADRETRRQN